MSEDKMDRLESRVEALERELAEIKTARPARMNHRERIEAYRRRWNCRNLTIKGEVRLGTPVLLLGEGSITIGDGVQFGYERDPFFFSGYILIDARRNAHIEIGEGAIINNNTTLIAEGEGIEIGVRALIAWSVEIFDSDFHDLDPRRRLGGQSVTRKVVVGSNALIGAHCAILKGSRIGADSVIGHRSIVTGDIPPGVIAAGSPARVIRPLAQQP
jgi:acetyltransferase-like isoleucine patch superfamily enzyme